MVTLGWGPPKQCPPPGRGHDPAALYPTAGVATGRLLGCAKLGVGGRHPANIPRGKLWSRVQHLCARILGAERVALKAAINFVVTPSHSITAINMQCDAATREELQADLTWMLCGPLIVASGGSSWNHIPRSVRGCRYIGAVVGAQRGYNVAEPQSAPANVSSTRVQLGRHCIWAVKGHVERNLVGMPQALVGRAPR